MSSSQHLDNTPFFLVGCVRSGTTLLRDLLRRHPRLECPEETHFFRWADPFGSFRYRSHYTKSKLLKTHREMDGFKEYGFHHILNHTHDRREMMSHYGRKFLELRGNPGGRWFDKTPQNVYGVLLIDAAWPCARFIHIHRHPLNVVASLMEGAVMPVHDLNGAINYWNEAADILERFRALAGERLMEISYESLTAAPGDTLARLLEFLGEDSSAMQADFEDVHPERNKYVEKLESPQIEEVLTRTRRGREQYGYGDAP